MEASVALLECSIEDEEGGEVEVDLVGTEFFDDESMIIIYRDQDGE
jgi:hypothetical protein